MRCLFGEFARQYLAIRVVRRLNSGDVIEMRAVRTKIAFQPLEPAA